MWKAACGTGENKMQSDFNISLMKARARKWLGNLEKNECTGSGSYSLSECQKKKLTEAIM